MRTTVKARFLFIDEFTKGVGRSLKKLIDFQLNLLGNRASYADGNPGMH